MSLRRVGRMTNVRKKAIGCVLAVCLMPLLVAAFYFLAGLSKAREYHGRVSDLAVLDARNHEALLKQMLPTGAQDIVYMVKPHAVAIYVDFTVPLAEFMEWCQQRQWEVEQIDREIPFPPVSGRDPHRLAVGLHHEHKTGKNGAGEGLGESLEIYYDARSSRCYFRQIR